MTCRTCEQTRRVVVHVWRKLRPRKRPSAVGTTKKPTAAAATLIAMNSKVTKRSKITMREMWDILEQEHGRPLAALTRYYTDDAEGWEWRFYRPPLWFWES